jgi:hypothetical protein
VPITGGRASKELVPSLMSGRRTVLLTSFIKIRLSSWENVHQAWYHVVGFLGKASSDSPLSGFYPPLGEKSEIDRDSSFFFFFSHGVRGDLFINVVWYLLNDADGDALDEVGIYLWE